MSLLPTIKWDETIAKTWAPGNIYAVDNQLTYSEFAGGEDKEMIPSSQRVRSRLSPPTFRGSVTKSSLYVIKDKFGNSEDKSIEINGELGWREFSYYLLFHFPTLPNKNFNDNDSLLRTDVKALKAWQTGKTGIPIVDAGMRELCKQATCITEYV